MLPARVAAATTLSVVLVLGTGVADAAPEAGIDAPVPRSPSFGPVIDDYAEWEPEDDCEPSAKPGTLALEDLLLDTYGPADIYIERSCVGGGSSGHHAGRALDWMHDVGDPQERDEADTFLNWLFAADQYGNRDAMLRRLGIMYVIWNRQIYQSYDPGWEPYSGSSPHTDHVHFSLSWDGAYKRTTYWNPQNSFPPVASCATPPTQPVPPTVDYGNGLGYIAITPTRLLDTRFAGQGVPQRCKLTSQGRLDITVTGRGGVPSSGVGAVVLNLTGVAPEGGTYLAAHPAGVTWSGTSSVNIGAGENTAALVVVPVGSNGMVSLQNGYGRTDVVVDLVGYHPMTGGTLYNAITPSRQLDTRTDADPLEARETRNVPLPVLPAGATGVVFNLTSVRPAGGGYLTVTAGGTGAGGTSSLNMVAGRVVANRVYVALAGDRSIDVYASARSDVLVDVVGWFGPTGKRYVPLTPVRAFDSRTGFGGAEELVAGQNQRIDLAVASLPPSAVAVVMTTTATVVSTSTHVTVWAHGMPVTATSDLNTAVGRNTANLVISGLEDGAVDALVGAGRTHLIGDVLGYFR